jgi:hypothetical protein
MTTGLAATCEGSVVQESACSNVQLAASLLSMLLVTCSQTRKQLCCVHCTCRHDDGPDPERQ